MNFRSIEPVKEAVWRGVMRRLLVPALFAFGIAGQQSAHADTLTVPAQYKTIQDAVNAANPGDTVLVSDGTYTGVKNREIDFGGIDLTVKSASGNPANCIIDCQQLGRGFAIQNGETTASHIEGFTIANGRTSANGGGIYAGNSSNPTITNCVFTGNSAVNGGGMYGGTVSNCTFTNNTISGANIEAYGGGMYGGAATNCTFTGNSATGAHATFGGGMYSGMAIRCTFNNNTANLGGGICNGTATSCTFTSNTAYANGGGGMYGGTATNCTFNSNTAGNNGGGGGINGGSAINCAFNGNTASGGNGGGGMYSGTATNCTFIGNTASGSSGGGIEIGTATNCVFYYNMADGEGGGVGGGSATNCVIFGNTANYYGGGTANASLLHCTVASNTANGSFGGGIYNAGNTTVTNCIVWNNTAMSSGFNIKNDGGTLTVTYSDIQRSYFGTGNIAADPMFVNINSGDLHLTANSPCINTGTATALPSPFSVLPATDLDGGNRIIGSKPDMGAYEYGNLGISGTLNLGVVPTAAAQNVTFQFRPAGGGAPINRPLSVLPDGAFRLYNIPDGDYNLWIKADKYLANLIPVSFSNGNANPIALTPLAGDTNNDNSIDSTDFGNLIGAYNSQASIPGSGYDIRDDFNGDGFVDSTDFGILIGNYNQQGDS